MATEAFNDRKRTRSDHGFSLLEMLVALTILAVVTTLMFSGFFSIVKAWKKEQVRTEKAERTRSICNLIRRQISCCFPAVPKLDPQKPPPPPEADSDSRFRGQKIPFFKGDGLRCAFVSLYSLHVSRLPGLSLVVYALEPSESWQGQALVEYETPYLCQDLPDLERDVNALAGGQEGGVRNVLLDGLSDASFSYLGVDLKEVGVKVDNEIVQEWRDAWSANSLGGLPDAMRIAFRKDEGRGGQPVPREFVIQISSRGDAPPPVKRNVVNAS